MLDVVAPTIVGAVLSLNAAVAGTVAMYEVFRRRRAGRPFGPGGKEA